MQPRLAYSSAAEYNYSSYPVKLEYTSTFQHATLPPALFIRYVALSPCAKKQPDCADKGFFSSHTRRGAALLAGLRRLSFRRTEHAEHAFGSTLGHAGH